MEVPIRVFVLKKAFLVEFHENPYELKYSIRNIARQELTDLYFEPVNIHAQIETEVPVDNFGKWLFGVKGFKGHYEQQIVDNNLIVIKLPVEIPEAVTIIEESLKILKSLKIIKDYQRITEEHSGCF